MLRCLFEMGTKGPSPPVRLPDPSVAATISARRERTRRLARESELNWKFWRWRPKCSLCTFQIAALCIGGVVLMVQHATSWTQSVKFHGHAGKVNTVNFSPDGKSIVTAGEDGTARIWDAASGEQTGVLQHEKEKVNDVEVPPAAFLTASFSSDGKTMITVCEGGRTTIWGSNLPGSNSFIDSISFARFSPDGAEILTFDRTNGCVFILDQSFRISGKLRVDPNSLSSASFTPNGELVVTGTDNGALQVWDKSGRMRGAMRGDVNFFRSPVFSSDGRTIATAGNDCSVRLWSAASSEDNKSILDSNLPTANADEAAARSRSRSWFVRPLKVMHGHSRYVGCTQFSPDGSRLVTVALDGSMRVWDGHDGDLLAKLAESGPWRSAVFSPDGSRICAVGAEGAVQMWDRRRSERWYGLLVFPELWLLVFVLAPALVWSIRRDRRSFIDIQAEVPSSRTQLPA